MTEQLKLLTTIVAYPIWMTGLSLVGKYSTLHMPFHRLQTVITTSSRSCEGAWNENILQSTLLCPLPPRIPKAAPELLDCSFKIEMFYHESFVRWIQNSSISTYPNCTNQNVPRTHYRAKMCRLVCSMGISNSRYERRKHPSQWHKFSNSLGVSSKKCFRENSEWLVCIVKKHLVFWKSFNVSNEGWNCEWR